MNEKEAGNLELKGKVALITGGTKGIGAATAVRFAELGADVAILGRHDDDDAKSVKAATHLKSFPPSRSAAAENPANSLQQKSPSAPPR